MQRLADLTTLCGVQHLPCDATDRVKLYNAGVKKLFIANAEDATCPVDKRFEHVQYPGGWTVEGPLDEAQPAVIIYRDGKEFARVVTGDTPDSYTIKAAF